MEPRQALRTSVLVITGEDVEQAVRFALEEERRSGADVTVAYPAWVAAATRSIVRSALEGIDGVQEVIAPRSAGGSLWRGYGPGRDWKPVDVDQRAPRLRTVWLPPALVEATRLVAVNDLRGDRESRPVIAIGLWALVAHPRQRTGARISGRRDGLATEIAIAIEAAHYLVIERYGASPALIAGHDPVAVEVVALGLRQLRVKRRDSLSKPWEDPLVQRATELDLGIRHPSELDLVWVVPARDGSHHRGGAEELAGLTGVGNWRLQMMPDVGRSGAE